MFTGIYFINTFLLLLENFMSNQKLENLLNLSLDATDEERRQSPDLSAGFNTAADTWTIIIKYVKNLDVLSQYSIQPTLLLGDYAILEVPRPLIEKIAALDEVIYVEKPKNLSFTVTEGRRVSCVSEVQNPISVSGNPASLSLFGNGCVVGIIDSGIDYANPVFCNADGTTRILAIWDQTEDGVPPAGYQIGAYYEEQQINEALRSDNPASQQNIVRTQDLSGHGTAVASIAAGNFAPDRRNSLGMATKSSIIAVKLGNPYQKSFPRTSELMLAIDFIVKKCIELGRPLALNLSFGNSYGSHTGTSLLETYIDTAASAGITSIIIGTGNEGITAGHTSGRIAAGQSAVIELSVASYESSLSVQIWKAYYDDMSFEIISPQGNSFVIPAQGPAAYRYRIENTNLLIYYGEPNPYSIYQEIYLDFLPEQSYINDGLWKIKITGQRIVNGEYHLWLPVESALNGSRFTTPSPYATLTIPSTSTKAISVGAYNPYNFSYASFSGRGYDLSSTILKNMIKPDISAPGVDITTAVPGGGFILNSGTSIAAPFVTGAAAMLMEWGIINGNDAFLYGEKLKAYLLSGARPLTGFEEYPNPYVGWGRLCVRDSIPV